MNPNQLKDQDIVVIGLARTAFGSFQGALGQIPAARLGAIAIQGALSRSGVKPEDVSEVFMGNVLQAGQGQAPARQAMIFAGIPSSVPATTVHKVCGSGMKTLIMGAQTLKAGDASIVVAGGMENMTLAPYLLPGARGGLRMGNQPFLDSMVHDGLWDPYNNQHMGNCAELCAREWKFSREMQDEYAIESFKRAQAAQSAGKFKSEIAAVWIPGKKGETTAFETDEGPTKVKFEKIPELKPVFDKAGSVTAANASTLNDGAAAMVLTTAAEAKRRGLKPIARIASYGGFAGKPEWFTTAPSHAMRQAMERAGWSAESVHLWEVNEAFAVVALAAQRELKIPRENLNVWGGAISIGHPIGASGTRIVGTLIQALRDGGKERGVAGICIGGGEATAVCVEVIA